MLDRVFLELGYKPPIGANLACATEGSASPPHAGKEVMRAFFIYLCLG